ncbi:menaquinol-cytochrome C reductase cytochrome b subunit precursor [Janibacter hoylei PVAS-1]|uniref:Cytochrome bc1 complex cytochrome b subunit n=1 Tax=Janibacter hoylei PVAS-1 TaxID=1210046 RepID=K1DZX3_9MICO|nr:ubiquinol-cytochrome c reductase cytochrome b subunit [Janibacter hoylei]EKA60286.1 menaquinol-cytochrome C reductase cytochrome b subunit precursor [Janibacter hoylei PVAS-1]MCW4603035.1 ubiquinol-cytochrome c reductase cytochrome b subunit [Janibacter hoylei]RWU83797.1 ubiquinol-cytochrome c reductase cytochrome b subunit [Janibacter hoylei PVAS-1]
MTANARPADALRADDAPAKAPLSPGVKKVGGVAGWIDDRTGAAKGVGYLMRKVFPDHWSFMLGEIAMYSMIVCMLTGVFLTFWFDPSMGHTTYEGSYAPLQGVEMSRAYASTLDISFDVKGGLLIRQIHHWSALLFIVALSVHMLRVFFTGAFRKPRELNWVIGCVLSLLALVEGFAGYSLPDDLLSGTGLRAAQGFMVAAPVIGSYLSYGLFGGTFPGEDIIPRLYSVHILLLPALLIALFTVHIVLVALQKHTQYPGPGKTNDNVVGFPVMPVYAAKAGGFFFIVFGGIALISALVQINAVWVHGPYEPNATTAGAQPDWYMGFPDGALRLLPGFMEFETFGFTWAWPVIVGALMVIPAFYGGMIAYPFIEAWVTGDKREHHLLDRPRNAPTRTALGMAALTLYGVLMFAASNDIIAIKFGMSINDITQILRVLTFVGPVIAFWATKRICLSLQRHDRDLVLHGRETGRIQRGAAGDFHEIHEPLDPHTRWTLVQHEAVAPLELEPAVDANGVEDKKKARKNKLRARLYSFYFDGAVQPVTPAELEAAHHEHGHEAIEAGDKVSTH